MSEDLIVQLRLLGQHIGETAAAEIERLRAKLAEAERRPDWEHVNVTYEKWKARAEAAEKRLASAKEVIAPFSDMAKHHAADAPEWRDHHAVHAMVLVGHLRAAAEWMEKGDE